MLLFFFLSHSHFMLAAAGLVTWCRMSLLKIAPEPRWLSLTMGVVIWRPAAILANACGMWPHPLTLTCGLKRACHSRSWLINPSRKYSRNFISRFWEGDVVCYINIFSLQRQTTEGWNKFRRVVENERSMEGMSAMTFTALHLSHQHHHNIKITSYVLAVHSIISFLI